MGVLNRFQDVVDGDLCEQFASLEADKQSTIAQELDRTPMEVIKKLEGGSIRFSTL